MTTLTETVKGFHAAEAALKLFDEQTKVERAKLKRRRDELECLVNEARAGLDSEKLDLAESVLAVCGLYRYGGEDRASVIRDAMQFIALGEKPQGCYRDLWTEFFGTKNYEHWRGQRSDHPYGYGPKHGSTVFSVGFRADVRKRDPKQLTPEETEACLYYLANIEAVQEAAETAAA